MFNYIKNFLSQRTLNQEQIKHRSQAYDSAVVAINHLSYEDAKRKFYLTVRTKDTIRLTSSPLELNQFDWYDSVPDSIRDLFRDTENVVVITNTIKFVVARNEFRRSEVSRVCFLGYDQDGFRIFATSLHEGIYVESEGDNLLETQLFDEPSLYPSAYHYFLIQIVEF